MASSFRASPWVPYQPTPDTSSGSQPALQPSTNPPGTTMVMSMSMDIDMDAPQISTLREEETPPPPAKKPGPKPGAGRKPKAPKLKLTEPVAWRQEQKRVAPSEEDFEDQQEDEEDQLIDDDDTAGTSSATLLASARSMDTTPRKKPGPKKKPKKDGEKKPKEKGDGVPSGAHSLAPTMSCFQVSPAQAHASPGPTDAPHIVVEGGSAQAEPIILKLSAVKKKQASPRKSAAAPRGRGKATKQRSAIPPTLAFEDTAMSEAGYTGTATSTPATLVVELPEDFDSGTPEMDVPIAPSSPATVTAQLPEEIPNLENVPIPQYPLPTRPFPVQPPIKITSGFAPPMALDRSGKKARHWKVAKREIRGIAGGRWFTKTWVGGKDSELAAAIASGATKLDEKTFMGHNASGLGPRMAISAPVGRGRGRGGSKSASVVGSAGPSRAGSTMPDAGPSVIRAPTKMRILQLPPSENGDSDMAPPEPSEP